MNCLMNNIVKILTAIAILILVTQHSNAQNWNEWFRQKKTQKKYLVQQIAALKVYLGYLKEGYGIVKKGLNTVGDIKQGKFDLDQSYLGSLKHVNSSIGKSANISGILTYHKLIINQFRKLKNECDGSDQFTIGEKNYVADVYANILKECDASLTDLDLVLADNEFEMKDDERLLRIDGIYSDMRDKYVFTRSFTNSTRMLLSQRSIDHSEVIVNGRLLEQ
jgi:hypothetical protein